MKPKLVSFLLASLIVMLAGRNLAGTAEDRPVELIPERNNNSKPLDADQMHVRLIAHTALSGIPSNGRTMALVVEADGDYGFGPILFWESSTNPPIQVDSIASINNVLRDLKLPDESGDKTAAFEEMIPVFSRQHLVDSKSTGFVVTRKSRTNLLHIVEHSVSAKKSADLEKCLVLPSVQCSGDRWSVTWLEVDRLGAIQRVTASGRSEPLSVQSVLHEFVQGPGFVPPAVLDFGVLVGRKALGNDDHQTPGERMRIR